MNPDHLVVDSTTGLVLDRKLGDKRLAIRAVPGGGTTAEELPDGAASVCLTDAQAAELARLGDAVELHYGAPQHPPQIHQLLFSDMLTHVLTPVALAQRPVGLIGWTFELPVAERPARPAADSDARSTVCLRAGAASVAAGLVIMDGPGGGRGGR